ESHEKKRLQGRWVLSRTGENGGMEVVYVDRFA
ncbi:MAG: hypothetical protein ACJA2B_001907, partial [Candidatus Endobugula sp.]